MFDFLTRLGGSKLRPVKAQDEPSNRPKYYQPERYYMRGPGPAWYAAHPEHADRSSDRKERQSSDER